VEHKNGIRVTSREIEVLEVIERVVVLVDDAEIEVVWLGRSIDWEVAEREVLLGDPQDCQQNHRRLQWERLDESPPQRFVLSAVFR